MNKLQEILFYILGRVVQDSSLEAERFVGLNQDDWEELYRLAKSQGVTAVLFDKLSNSFTENEDFPKPPKKITLKWYAQSMSIEQKMGVIHHRSAEFAEQMARNGLNTLVLKGVAVSAYYPNPLHREFGDLDCYLFEGTTDNPVWDNGYEKGNVAAEEAGCVVKRGHYKHSHIIYNGMEIENHQFSLAIKDGKETRELEKHLRSVVLPVQQKDDTKLLMPSANFNALFLTAHAMSHFLYESIKLRHVLDWALFLKAEKKNIDWNAFWMWCDKMHYTRFVECLNYICEANLGVQLNVPTVKNKVSYNKVELSERIIQDFFSDESIYAKGYGWLRFRVVLAMSYFKALWKFKHVYQRNAMWLLLKRAWGMTIKNVKL